MDIQTLYDLIEAHLDNKTDCDQLEKMGKLKRVQLPIPKEYGGGFATGYGYEDAIRKLISRIRDKIIPEKESPLFKECWESWIQIKMGQNRSPATIDNYKGLAKNHLLPFLEDKKISEITSDDIQTYFNSIMDLSGSVSTQSKAILCGIFDRALRMGYVDRNIMLYKYERSHKKGQKKVLQDDDLIGVISRIDRLRTNDDFRDYIYACFLCFTALRRGEILGLKWEDIDFENSEIHVRNNVIFPNGCNDGYIKEPKDGSFGTVLLQSGLASRLKSYQKVSGYILPYATNVVNKPMTRSMFTKMWRRIVKTVDLHGATSHSFRASYATMMNAHCDHIDPKALQGALRHKTPDLAIKIYTKENENKTRIAEKEYDAWLTNQLA